MPSEDSYILSLLPPSITLTAERDVVSFCRDGRLANIARALALMVQTVEIGRCVVLTTCWYKTCDSRGEQHLRDKTEVFMNKNTTPVERLS